MDFYREIPFEELWIRLAYPFFMPIVSQERVYIPYLLSAVAMALIAYGARTGIASFSTKEFLKFLLPKAVFLSRSAKVDYAYTAIYKAVFVTLILPFLISTYMASSAIGNFLGRHFTPPELWPGLPPAAISLAYSFGAVLAMDFALFLAHYWQHKNPYLWEFHKVHHSAQVLTPITVYRMHPIDDIVAITCVSICTGLNHAIFTFFASGRFAEITFFGINFLTFLYYFLGYNLRHSHIWLSYGPSLSRILISPAQHQIHHSNAMVHRDRNLGFIFAFWDGAAGTLVVPERELKLELGLSRGEDDEYQSVRRLFLLPFAKAARRLAARLNTRR